MLLAVNVLEKTFLPYLVDTLSDGVFEAFTDAKHFSQKKWHRNVLLGVSSVYVGLLTARRSNFKSKWLDH